MVDYPSFRDQENVAHIQKYIIDGMEVDLLSEDVRLSTRYSIRIENCEYHVFAESIKDTEGQDDYKYGRLVYLDQIESVSDNAIDPDILSLIERAIILKYNNSDMFIEFQRNDNIKWDFVGKERL